MTDTPAPGHGDADRHEGTDAPLDPPQPERELSASEAEDLELFRSYRESASRLVRNRLVERHMGLAAHIAKRFGRASGTDDVRQVAMLGLVKAVERFDPEHGATFSSFAGRTIEGEIKRHFRDRTWSVRVPRSAKELHLVVRSAGDRLSQQLGRGPTVDELAAELGLDREDVLRGLAAGAAYQIGSLDALNATSDEDLGSADRVAMLATDDPGFRDSEDRQVVDRLLRHLSGRERRIVELRFYGEKSQSEIAEIVGISQMHVSRLLRRSFEHMRAQLGDR